MSIELQRYGRGPEDSPYLLRAIPDGYWTPWHVADAEIRRLQREAERLQRLLDAAHKITGELARPSGI